MNKDKKAKVTIGRRYGNKDCISISIIDTSSGIKVCDVELSLADFSSAITGLASVEGVLQYVPTPYTVERYGKRKVIKRIMLQSIKTYTEQGKLDLKDMIAKLPEITSGEWELRDDGLQISQPVEGHFITLCKYVED